MAKIKLSIKCKPFGAKLSNRGCRQNQKRAEQAALRLKESEPGASLLISDLDLDRLSGCSQCSRFLENNGKSLESVYIDAITRDIMIIVDQVLTWDTTWDYNDPGAQRSRMRKTKARYNLTAKAKAAKLKYEQSGKRPKRWKPSHFPSHQS